MTSEAVQYTRRSGRTLLHQTVEYEMQFAGGKCKIFWEIPLKRNKVHESDIENKKQRWTTISTFCTLIHRITGGERVLQPQTTPQGRPTPSTSWPKVQNSYHCPQTGKQIQNGVCPQKTNQEKI
jgi:hypothetical protein